jgi:hypothetical protein
MPRRNHLNRPGQHKANHDYFEPERVKRKRKKVKERNTIRQRKWRAL